MRRTALRVALTLVLALAAPSAAQAAITIADTTVTEAGTAVFTITRMAGVLSGGASVGFQTTDGSARAPADYTTTSGVLSFGAAPFGGTQTQQVVVTVRNDALDEPDETFRVVLSGSGELADADATATIRDDDPAPAVSVADAVPAAEGAPAAFAVSLSAPSGRDVSVSYTTVDATATAPADYTASAGALTIPAGATGATVPVALADDAADEPNETFELRLSSPHSATLGDAAGVATIVDNDDPAQPPPPPPPPPPPSFPATGSSTSAQARLGMASPRLRRPSTVLITISCPKAAISCRGRMSVYSRASKASKVKALRKERKLGRITFKLAGGRVETLELSLGKTDRRLLERAGRLGVRAYAIVEDGTGRTSVRTAQGTLVARLGHSGVG